MNLVKTHRPLLLVTVAFGLGIFFSQYLRLSPGWCVFAAAVCLFLGAINFRHGRGGGLFIAVLFVVLGMLCAREAQIPARDHLLYSYPRYQKWPVRLEGLVISDVQKRVHFKGKKDVFILKARRCETKDGWKEVSGKVQVQIFRDTRVCYGDEVRLTGKIYKPFNYSPDEKFSYPEYLRRQGIYLMFSVGRAGAYEIMRSHAGTGWKEASYRLKKRLMKIFQEYLTPNEAAIMIGMILGDRYFIPGYINELFVQTGTSHILAISGFNVGIVAFIVFVLIKVFPIGRRWQYVLTIAFLIFYAFLTGAQSSVVRAAIMAVVFLSSFLLEREIEPLNSLSLAALLILMFRPLALFEVGFQLSFICVWALIVLVPRVLGLWPKSFLEKESGVIAFCIQSLSGSATVWVAVAGLIAYYFQIITPVTILANLVVIPLSTVLIILGFGMILAASLMPAAAILFALCIKVTLNVMIGCIYLFSQSPWAYIYVTAVPVWVVGVYYMFIFGTAWALRKRKSFEMPKAM